MSKKSEFSLRPLDWGKEEVILLMITRRKRNYYKVEIVGRYILGGNSALTSGKGMEKRI